MPTVLTGLDVLVQRHTKLLRGRTIGLLAHQASVDRTLTHAAELLADLRGTRLVRLLAPEHGLWGSAQDHAHIRSTRDPVTGRPILFVNPLHTHGFQGMAKDEAWKLIEELAAHSTQDRFVYYHSWRVGDVLMWDEKATLHRGAGDYRPDERRVMLRTIVYPN